MWPEEIVPRTIPGRLRLGEQGENKKYGTIWITQTHTTHNVNIILLLLPSYLHVIYGQEYAISLSDNGTSSAPIFLIADILKNGTPSGLHIYSSFKLVNDHTFSWARYDDVTFVCTLWPVGSWRKNGDHRASCFLRQCFIPGFFRLREPVNLRTGSGVGCSNLRETFSVARSNPVRRAVGTLVTSYQLTWLGLDIFWSWLPLFALALELLSRFGTLFFTTFLCCIWLDISFCSSNSWISKRLVDMWDWI